MKVTASIGGGKYLVEATDEEIAHLIHGDGFYALPTRMRDTPAGSVHESNGLRIGLTFDLEELPVTVIPPDNEPCIEISGRGMAVRSLGNLLLMLPAEITEGCAVHRKRGWFYPPRRTVILTRTAARAVLHMIDAHRSAITRAVSTAPPGNHGVSMRDAHTFILLTAVRSLFPTHGILPEPIEIA